MVTFDITMQFLTLSKTKAKELKSLTLKKERDKKGLFLVEGEKCVLDTIGAFDVKFLICSENWATLHNEIIKEYKERILISDKRGFEMISSLNSLPEVIAILHKPEYSDDIPNLETEQLYLLLDEIQDPGNLGTIIRTCDWFGIYEIFASRNTVDVYTPKVIQSTMGSLSRVKIHYMDLEKLIERNPQMRVIGTLLNGVSVYDENLPKSGLLIMGNEGRGISENLKSKVNIPLTIPPINPVSHPDSLNVSVATAIIISRLRSQTLWNIP